MTTLISLRIGSVQQVDLDQLTPRARALAEAIHQCAGHTPTGIVFETGRQMKDGRNFALRYGAGPRAQEMGDRPEQAVINNWSPVSSIEGTRRVARDATVWLEREARSFPLDWYPIGAASFPFGSGAEEVQRVPSADAAAADRYLTPDTVLEYMRERGAPLGVHAWDTLRGTGHLPEPDRHVCGQPQWRPEAIDTYINRDRELWPISRVAEYLGYSGPSATGTARKQLHRWGITAEGRAPGRGGESLYAADQVQAAHTHRPGRGTRTDLKDSHA